MPVVDQAPLHGAIVDPSELAAVPGSMLDAAKAYAADVLSLPAEPPRTLPVTPAERACATVLRAWRDWPGMADTDIVSEDVMCDLTRSLRARGLAKGGSLTPAGAALLARVEAAERTPETVLRAMLVSYEADAIEKARAYYADPGVDASLLRATNEADTDVEIVRDQLAILLAKGFTTFTVSMSTIGADYAARLAGTTPIDAPPAKEPAR